VAKGDQVSEILWGDALADRAWTWLSSTSQSSAGIDEIERGLEIDGVQIRGDNPRRVLGSALNHSQHKFQRVARGTWRAIPRSEWTDPAAGVSGSELEDAAYAAAMSLDPRRQGFHYEDLKRRLSSSGIAIRGKNPGQTLRTLLARSPRFRARPGRKGLWGWV
jgi:hypothetical protein